MILPNGKLILAHEIIKRKSYQSATEIASSLGVHLSTINRYIDELNKLSIEDYDLLRSICN